MTKHFNWTLLRILPCHFLNTLLTNGIFFDNEINIISLRSETQRTALVENTAKAALKILDSCSFHIKLRQFSASQIAAACILSARQSMGVEVVWTKELRFLTKYTENDLKPVLKIMNPQQQNASANKSPAPKISTQSPKNLSISKIEESQQSEVKVIKKAGRTNIFKSSKSVEPVLPLTSTICLVEALQPQDFSKAKDVVKAERISKDQLKTRDEKKPSMHYDANMTEKTQNSSIIPLRTKKPQTMKKHNESVKTSSKAKFSLA